MYNNVYQEYINNMLGTMPRSEMDFQNNSPMNLNTYSNFQNPSPTNMELENYYPDLYRLLYPMIQSACMRNTKPITSETIDNMVNDIYSNFTSDEAILLNINLTNDVRSGSSNNSKVDKSANSKISTTSQTEMRNKSEGENRVTRRPNNYVLNDLIRILLIRELLGRPGNFPPNRPGFPPPRPPFRPRDIQSMDYNIYEDPINMYSNYNF